MIPPADTLLWTAVCTAVVVILCSTVLYRPIQAIEERQGIHFGPTGMPQRIVGVASGIIALVVAALYAWLPD